MASPIPHHAPRGTWWPRRRAISAAHTGWVDTSATDDATDVNDRLGIQVAKWAARNTPASSDSRRSRRSRPASAARPRADAHTNTASTGSARALRQKAMASVGASATRTSGADVDTATTATPSSTRSGVGGAVVAGRDSVGGEAMAAPASHAATSPCPCSKGAKR